MNYSATQMAKKLNISRSYLYYLKDNGVVELEVDENGKLFGRILFTGGYGNISRRTITIKRKTRTRLYIRRQKSITEDIWGININYFLL